MSQKEPIIYSKRYQAPTLETQTYTEEEQAKIKDFLHRADDESVLEPQLEKADDIRKFINMAKKAAGDFLLCIDIRKEMDAIVVDLCFEYEVYPYSFIRRLIPLLKTCNEIHFSPAEGQTDVFKFSLTISLMIFILPVYFLMAAFNGCYKIYRERA